MIKVVGIGFKEVGKIYWFNPFPLTVRLHEKVIVETVRGYELGTVIQEAREIDDADIEREIKPIVRIATKADIIAYEENLERAKTALEVCRRTIKNHKLEMKLLDCEYTIDRQKIIIYYTAEGRVDFRELLKDLASEFRIRIELRQVGPREGAKFIGGIGPCGREVCCASHLREFGLVTMKMAKDQGMTLSSSKVAGLCGKLMCCIAYENDLYQDLRSRIPLVGDMVKTPTCENCRVVNVDLLREMVKTINGDNIEVWQAKDLVKLTEHKEDVKPEDLTDDVVDNNGNDS
ncbi:MAG: stage 0 sporulation family protein [Bacilli bacterium]